MNFIRKKRMFVRLSPVQKTFSFVMCKHDCVARERNKTAEDFYKGDGEGVGSSSTC